MSSSKNLHKMFGEPELSRVSEFLGRQTLNTPKMKLFQGFPRHVSAKDPDSGGPTAVAAVHGRGDVRGRVPEACGQLLASTSVCRMFVFSPVVFSKGIDLIIRNMFSFFPGSEEANGGPLFLASSSALPAELEDRSPGEVACM